MLQELGTGHRVIAQTPGAGRARASVFKQINIGKINIHRFSPINPIRPPSPAPSPENGASSKAFAFPRGGVEQNRSKPGSAPPSQMFAALGGKPGGCKDIFRAVGTAAPLHCSTRHRSCPPAPAPAHPAQEHLPTPHGHLCFHLWTSCEFRALSPPKNPTLTILRSKQSPFIWWVKLSTASLVHPCSCYELGLDVKYKKNVKTSYIKSKLQPCGSGKAAFPVVSLTYTQNIFQGLSAAVGQHSSPQPDLTATIPGPEFTLLLETLRPPWE